jgi:hypothetical protein
LPSIYPLLLEFLDLMVFITKNPLIFAIFYSSKVPEWQAKKWVDVALHVIK